MTTPIIDPSQLTEEQKIAVLKKFSDAVEIDTPLSMKYNRVAAQQTKHVLTWLFGIEFFKK